MMPNNKTIAKILKSKKLETTHIISKNAPRVDKIKFALCQEIIKIKIGRDIPNTELAKMLHVTPAVTTRIVHCYIERFTIDTLITYYERLLEAIHDNSSKKKLDEWMRQIEEFNEAA